MNIIKTHYNIIATIAFVLAILVAHFFSPSHYQWTKNTISDLGSQGYDKKLIMQIGFLAFGFILVTGILINGLSWRTTPVLVYGLCVGLTGVFCTKPFAGDGQYSALQATMHAVLAQAAGVFFTIGILVQTVFTPNNPEKWIHFLFFLLVIGLSASFGLLHHFQGIAQRLLYLISLIWLIFIYKA